MRNLQAAMRREQKIRSQVVRQTHNVSAVRSALAAAEATLATLNSRYDELEARMEQGDEERHKARLNVLRAQNEHDRLIRKFERARLYAIEAHLPTADESIRFLIARLMSDDTCLACGTGGVRVKRAALESAFEQHRCPICDSNLTTSDEAVVDLGDRRITELRTTVDSARVYLQQQTNSLEEISARFDADSKSFSECAAERSDVQGNIQTLINQLPQDERKIREQQDRLAGVESLVAELRAQLNQERSRFVESLNAYRETIQTNAEAVKNCFKIAARGFLFEESDLSWAPLRRTVGQAGGMEPVEYPAFAVELSGSDFVGLQRRSSPNQVSESQREFIDLAFRMALIEVASPEGASTLVIDAPESSLDAVFVDKAAEVLGNFAKSARGSRLILTSNLGAGELVPQLLKEVSPVGDRMAPVIDLFAAGVPTRAMIKSRDAYDRYWGQLKAKVDGGVNA
jgi:predicted  nucleic acid-binding Zn-ribbon protein